jgi:EmrB/QacA subfamily drug resistance transporter
MDQTVAATGLPGHTEARRIILGVMLATFLASLDQTIVATALPTIGRDLNDVANLPWIVTAYLLTSTVVTPVYGKLADIFGRRAVMLSAIGIFLFGSVLCALSPTMLVLIVARGIQGLGGGGLVSLAQTIIGDVVAPRERGRYQGYIGAVYMAANLAGPVLGGFFAQNLHWSLIFWINLPLAGLALLMIDRLLRKLPRHEQPHRIDYAGAALMVAGTTALLLALSWGGSAYAWASLQIIGLLVLCVLAWVAFILRQRAAPEPFLPLDVVLNPVVSSGVGMTFFAVGGMIGLSIYVPLYFEAVLGLTAGQSGLAMVGLMGATVVGATLTGRAMTHVRHYKLPPLVGLPLGAAATLLLAFWPFTPSMWLIEILVIVIGLATGTVYPVGTTSIQNAVPLHRLGVATGIANFARLLGGAVMVAVLGAILFGRDMAGDTAIAVPGHPELAGPYGAVFATIALSLMIAWFCLLAMKEVPLRGRDAAAPAA